MENYWSTEPVRPDWSEPRLVDTKTIKLGCLLLRPAPFFSTPPPPPNCFYFLRISISSFIYLFVINLNDPRMEAGLEERPEDDE